MWEIILSDISGTVIGAGTGTDSELFDISWFGIFYEYSSTRDRLLWLDEISVEGPFIENYEPVKAVTGDVVITEIMADPYPVVKLPEIEYLEIFNRSDKRLSLRNWELRYEGHMAIYICRRIFIVMSCIGYLCSCRIWENGWTQIFPCSY